ncbi:DUF5683 domain-containing protein [Pedobacter metabolipauper]|uniref:DUF5683 domain-containing protein n=1 Tax=Pedobacter metabolipauper TaxID=425513 RepID=A0A4V3D136_9SPHI|nr:DUF5683 domain-containing protein [Pedobacter metabolipauper]TDQ08834.1 hypothetical protein ATK78_3353 [Pedobacter metabolipauper]
MNKFLLVSGLLFFMALTVNAQEPVRTKRDSTTRKARVDTLKEPAYVNVGRIEGRKALFRSMIVPGLGQIQSGPNLYRLAKVAGIYTGATLLTLSYIDNNKMYHVYYDELKDRADNVDGKPSETSPYKSISDASLITARDTYRRNKEVVIFSYVGLYLLNILDAYVDARLKYWSVDEDLTFKVSPDLIQTNKMYGFNTIRPGVRITLQF